MSVYYIHALELGMVKIGHAGDPWRRFMEIQVASPTRVVLLAVEDGGSEIEAQRHTDFAALRARGEWFRYEGALKLYVEALSPFVREKRSLPGPLGEWITANGHTLESFGNMIGVWPGTVSRICAGEMSPAAFVHRIYDATNGEIDANTLFGLPPKPVAAEPAAATG